MTVVVLEDAAEDIELGRGFYESCEAGVGDYFTESILSDLDSLAPFAGIHPSILDSIGCCRNDSRLVSTMTSKRAWHTFMPFWI